MSTDIFQNKDETRQGPDPYAHLTPLQVYLAASLPLTCATLMVWACFHWWEKHKEKLKKLRTLAQRAPSMFQV